MLLAVLNGAMRNVSIKMAHLWKLENSNIIYSVSEKTWNYYTQSRIILTERQQSLYQQSKHIQHSAKIHWNQCSVFTGWQLLHTWLNGNISGSSRQLNPLYRAVLWAEGIKPLYHISTGGIGIVFPEQGKTLVCINYPGRSKGFHTWKDENKLSNVEATSTHCFYTTECYFRVSTTTQVIRVKADAKTPESSP